MRQDLYGPRLANITKHIPNAIETTPGKKPNQEKTPTGSPTPSSSSSALEEFNKKLEEMRAAATPEPAVADGEEDSQAQQLQ